MLNPFSDQVQALLAAPAAKLAYMQESFKNRMKRLRIRANLKSQQEAAEAIGCERGTVGMWEAPSSPVDSVSGEYLMRVAAAYKVRPEYINSGEGDDGYPWNGEGASDSHSHPVRLDPEIVQHVANALAKRYRSAGGYNLAERPGEFIRAYELWTGIPDAYASPEVFELVISHADLSPQGASKDEQRSEGVPTTGSPRAGVRSGRGSKT